MDIDEEELRRYKSYLFIAGGFFAAGLGMYFSKRGFGFELPDVSWIGWGLGILCFIVQIAFSSQMAYKTNNYVIWLCGFLAYVYSGWSNHTGIVDMNPKINDLFAWFLALFVDWVAEPLIVFGLIGATMTAQGDFLRNLLGMRPGQKGKDKAESYRPQGDGASRRTDEKSTARKFAPPEPDNEPGYIPYVNARNRAPSFGGQQKKKGHQQYAAKDD